jgi:hypothetical protein
MSEPPPGPAPRLPVVTQPNRRETRRERAAAGPAAGAFDAQLLGQGGARRGLRGGAPVLEEAQHAYLETEWSGPADRRAATGRTRREKI